MGKVGLKVRCISNTGAEHWLTIGRVYTVYGLWLEATVLIRVEDDQGRLWAYSFRMFEPVSEERLTLATFIATLENTEDGYDKDG